MSVKSLRFDVSVEDAISVHVIDGLEDLIHVILDPLLGQIMPPAFDSFVHIHIHEFKH